MEITKEKIIYAWLIGFIVILMVGVGIMSSKYQKAQKKLVNAAEKYADLKKEKDGLYSDLVNTQNSNKTLRDSIKAQGEEMELLYKRIRKSNEQILSMEKLIIQLHEQLDTLSIQKDTIFIAGDTVVVESFDAYYPEKEDWFIHYHGQIKGEQVFGNWKTGQLQLNLVKTLTSEGLTKVYLQAPKWIIANEVSVMTKEEKPAEKFSKFYIGGGWFEMYDKSYRGPLLKGAYGIKSKFLITATLGGQFVEIGGLYGL